MPEIITRADVERETYGIDALTYPSGSPTDGIAEGRALILQSIINRLSTRQGSLFYAPEYGEDLLEMIGESLTPASISTWSSRIESQVLAEEGVDSARVSISVDASSVDSIKAKVKIRATLTLGETLEFVLSVGDFAVKLEEIASAIA